MKFFHLSDLHLGIRLKERSLREDQEHILRQITEAARTEAPDAVVIAGDIFDKADPPAEAVTVFDRFITDLREAAPGAAIMIVSGNHDSGERTDLYRAVLKTAGVHVAGSLPRRPEDRMEKVTLSDGTVQTDFYLLPFVRPGAVRSLLRPGSSEPLTYQEAVRSLIGREQLDPAHKNVLISHQFYVSSGQDADAVDHMDSEMTRGSVEAVPADILQPFDYAALGHLHRQQQAAGNAYYCGTPLAYSVSEADQEKGFFIVELQEGEPAAVRPYPLVPLRRVRRLQGSLEEVLQEAGGDYVEIVLVGEKSRDQDEIRGRIQAAFPNRLSCIHAESYDSAPAARAAARLRSLDPMELCLLFLGDNADEEDIHILRQILAEVEG